MSDFFPNASGRAIAAAAITAALAITAMFIVAGHSDRRIIQMLLLAVPAFATLFISISNPAWRAVRAVVVWMIGMAFIADGATRFYLELLYQAPPDSSVVLTAIANASASETSEYLQTSWRPLATAVASLVVAGSLLALAIYTATQATVIYDEPKPKKSYDGAVKFILVLVLLICALAYLSKPWRRLHPVVYWTNWHAAVNTLRESWLDQEIAIVKAMGAARKIGPTLSFEGRSTVVLVIADSINRDNLGIYGYARDTTPRLQQRKAMLGEQLVVMRNAWSSEASTVPSVNSIFHSPDTSDEKGPHMVALARAAGYKVWWISNQADTAIEYQHARFADHFLMINRTPGRNSRLLDDETLAPLKRALADASPRKLVIVHLMGAHPHYSLRYPAAANPYDDQPDKVDREMRAQGKPRWVREFREEYDAAVLFHDKVVSASLDLTRSYGEPNDYRAWMYLSDHGQEVGHSTHRVGHSPSTPAGYRIPALIWQSDSRSVLPYGVDVRPFRADWSDMTLSHLLGLQWNGYRSEQDVLSVEYVWRSPKLAVSIPSFVQ